jgi:hypothetical protein
MTWLHAITHLTAAFGGALVTLLSFAKRLRKIKAEEKAMANKFLSILGDVGKGLLWVFTNKAAQAVEAGGLNMAALIWPGLAPLFGRLSNAIANAHAQALVSTAGMSTEQIIAMVITDAQADFQTAGITETAQQQEIVAAAIAFIDSLPSGSVNASVVQQSVAAETAAAPGPVAVPAAPPAATASAAKPVESSTLAPA